MVCRGRVDDALIMEEKEEAAGYPLVEDPDRPGKMIKQKVESSEMMLAPYPRQIAARAP